MAELYADIAIVMTICFATWGIFYNLLHRRLGINYTEHFWVTTAYFLLSGGLCVFLFGDRLKELFVQTPITPFIALSMLVMLLVAHTLYLPKKIKEPRDYFVQHPDRYYLKIDWRRAISKSADIAAQQIIIVLLILFLNDLGLSLLGVTFWFFVLFALLHVPLIASERGRWPSFLFTGAVVAFSAAFPLLILFVPNGFVYTFILHWLFYILTATVFWIWYTLRA